MVHVVALIHLFLLYYFHCKKSTIFVFLNRLYLFFAPSSFLLLWRIYISYVVINFSLIE